MPVRLAENQRTNQVHRQADDRDGQRFGIGDRLGGNEPLDRAEHHRCRDAEQAKRAGVTGKDFDFPGTEGETRVMGVLAGGTIGESRKADGQRVRAHVPAVGEYGHRIEPPAGDDLE